MHIFLVTLFPNALKSYFETSIMRKALESEVVSITVCNLADFSGKNTRRSDDRPYGGMSGTILAPEPCAKAIDHCQSLTQNPITWICPDPRGEIIEQKDFFNLSQIQDV